MDTSWVSCHHALTMTESLNKGILSEIVTIDPEVCKQQWPHEDHWKMANPLIGYDDPYYHNHELDADVPRKRWMALDIFSTYKK